ncbi:MAG: hypothetical protein WBL19_01420 [Minisyncoccia bacterium]
MHDKALLLIGFASLIALAILFTTPMDDKKPAPAPGGGTKLTLCRATGCSGQICAEEDLITTCEFREEYACYQNARCERQPSGGCGWTETPELRQCLSRSGAQAI